MTREQAIQLAERSATEIPMANRALIAGVIDILTSLDVIRVSEDFPSASELHRHKNAAPSAL